MNKLFKLVEYSLKIVSFKPHGVEQYHGEMNSASKTTKDNDDGILENNDNIDKENNNRKVICFAQSRKIQQSQQDVAIKLEIKLDEHSNSYDALIKCQDMLREVQQWNLCCKSRYSK